MRTRRQARWSLVLALALAWPSSASLAWATTAHATSGATARLGPSAEVPEGDASPSAAPEAGSVPEPEPPPEDGAPSAGSDPSSPKTGATAADPASPTGPSPEQLAEEELAFARNEARRHYNEAERLFDAGLYAEAAVEFERSYAAVPATSVLYNAAVAHERASKPVEAIRVLRRYLKIADCKSLPPEGRNMFCAMRRDEAKDLLEEQRRFVGELTLKIAEGVELREVRVAGRSVPLDDFPLLLMPSTIDVELLGMGPDDRITRPAYITAGQIYEVYVPPFEDDAIVPPPIVDPNPGLDDRLRREQRARRLRVAFYSGVGLTVISGVALGIMGGLTNFHRREHDREKCEMECYETDADGNFILDDDGQRIPKNTGYPIDHLQTAERYQPVANALVGVTVGLGVATALVGGFAFRKRDGERPPGKPRAHLGLRPTGLVVRW